MTEEELQSAIARQFGRSLHIRTLDTGSCAVCEQEIRLLAAPHYDLHRLGFFFTPAPRPLVSVTRPSDDDPACWRTWCGRCSQATSTSTWRVFAVILLVSRQPAP
ncbi:MAG TPA: hypothetical protein VF223_11100 [Trebonia sp.]